MKSHVDFTIFRISRKKETVIFYFFYMGSLFAIGVVAVALIGGAFYSGYIGNSNHSKSPTDIDTNPMTDDLDSQFTDSWGVALMQGKRPYMEDTYSTYFSSSGISYFGVYDGHGNDVSKN